MCEGVTVRNPKTDSKSEVGCSRYGATNRGSTREMCKSRVATWPARVGGREPHGQGSPLLPWAPRTPHGVVTWQHMIRSENLSFSLLLSKPPSLHTYAIFFEEHLNPASVFQNFCLLVLIISLSYELEIIRFKNQNCWSRDRKSVV